MSPLAPVPARGCWLPWALMFAWMVCPSPVAAQEGERTATTVVTAAGERYRAGPLHRWILGRHYRDLWTARMEVEVLDLATFAGGIEPTRTGGGRQTRSLRFQGADGREYAFRSVDKDPSPVLDSLLWDTFIDDLVQDGISAAHPLGALVAAPLLEAAGILHVDPQLRVMPDDPALGEFREEFAGMLGLIEERPNENEGGTTAFQGAVRVTASETLTERLEESPANRVDARAFLTARLMDVFLGDWDRHRGQWRWATYRDDEPRTWLPVPTDRDQAFSKFDGIAPRLVSLYMPQFVRFEPDYPAIERLHWNARALDRWFLSGLERPVWDSVGVFLQSRISDDVIDAAVRQLPPEIQALNGAELGRTLRARRDALDEAWDAFYRLLAQEVDVHGTDAVETVLVDRGTPGRLVVSVTAPDHDEEPYFRRVFDAGETREIRLYLRGGDDRVSVTGDANPDVVLRVVGGPGDDRFEVDGRGRNVRLYDSRGQNAVTGPVSLERKHFEEWVWTEENRDQPRDWGQRTTPIFWTWYSTDLGVFLGGGGRLERYAFRKRPFSTAFDVRGGYSLTQGKGRLEVNARTHAENSPLFGTFRVRYSGLDVINYFGLGNDTPGGDRDFYEVDHRAASVSTSLGVESGSGLSVEGGLVLRWTSTSENTGRFFETVRDTTYGAIDFLRLGVSAGLVFDPQRDSRDAASRVRVSLGATAFPKYFVDVERSFAKAGGRVSVLLSSSRDAAVALALQGGAEKVWGRYPWSEASFLGGGSDLRGWDEQRFAGDASLFGSSELRVRLGHPRVVVPVGMGLFGFTDVGRVYVEGSSPGGWHSSFGGGIWMQPMGHRYLFRWGVGVSDEATKVYLTLGLPS